MQEAQKNRLRKRVPFLIARGIIRQALLLGLFFGAAALFPSWGIDRHHGWFSWVGYLVCYMVAAWLIELLAKKKKTTVPVSQEGSGSAVDL